MGYTVSGFDHGRNIFVSPIDLFRIEMSVRGRIVLAILQVGDYPVELEPRKSKTNGS